MHSNQVDGGIFKKNFYCGPPDCMQINFSQSPVERLDIAKKLLTIVSKFPSQAKFTKDIISLQEESTKKVQKLIGNCDNLLISESAVRAEIRVQLGRSISFASLLDHHIDEDFVASNCIILDMATLSKLIKFWISLLFQPIITSLSKLLYCYNDLGTSENPLEKYLPTISAFESLLTSSLFSGNTWSFLPSYLYGKSKADRMSFELLKSIKERNRVDFSGELWVKDDLLIASDAKLLDELVKKFRIPNMDRVIETFNLLINIRNTRNMKEIAILLWNSYFRSLWDKIPEDFTDGVSGNARLKESVLILTDDVKMAKKELTVETAARHVFSVERLENSKAKNSDVWSFPHLLAYKELTNGDSKLKDKISLDTALVEVAAEIKIEYIHVHGDETHFFQNSKKRTYFSVKAPQQNPFEAMVSKSKAVTPVRVSNPLNLAPLTPVSPSSPSPKCQNIQIEKQVLPVKALYSSEQTFTVSSKRKNPPVRIIEDYYANHRNDNRPFIPTEHQPRQKRQKIRFSDQEKINFFIGLNTFKDSTNIFSDIANCEALGFCNQNVAGKLRTNKNLKDLEVTLMSRKEVRVDARTQTIYWSGSTPSACRARPEIIDAPITENIDSIDPSLLRSLQNQSESIATVQEDQELSLIRKSIEKNRSSISKESSSTTVTQLPAPAPPNLKIIDMGHLDFDTPVVRSNREKFLSSLKPKAPSPLASQINFSVCTDASQSTANSSRDVTGKEFDEKDIISLASEDEEANQRLLSEYLYEEFNSVKQTMLTDPCQPEPMQQIFNILDDNPFSSFESSSLPLVNHPSPQAPTTHVKKAPSKPKAPRDAPIVPSSTDPETERINQELIGIINEIYGDDTAGQYYLNIIRKIPTSFEEGWNLTWAGIAKYMMNNKRRITEKWNLLKQKLLSMNLIEEGKGNIIIRKFI